MDQEIIKLVAVDGEEFFTRDFPGIVLSDFKAKKSFHDSDQEFVVIAEDPNYFHAPFFFGEVANVGD